MLNLTGDNVWRNNVRVADGADRRNATTEAATGSDLADRTAWLRAHTDALENVVYNGINYLYQKDTIAEMAAADVADKWVCLVPGYGLFVCRQSLGSAKHPDGVTRIQSTYNSAWVWIKINAPNENGGWPVIGPSYPYDGTVAGKSTNHSGQINEAQVPNHYVGTYHLGDTQLGTMDADNYVQFEIKNTSAQVTNSLYTIPDLTTQLGDIITGSVTYFAFNTSVNHTTPDFAQVALRFSQNGSNYLASVYRVRPSSSGSIVTQTFSFTISTPGSLGCYLYADGPVDPTYSLYVASAFTQVDGAPWRYGQLTIIRP